MDVIPREKLGNLNKHSLIELQDLLRRQEDILSNKSFVRKLPDKGAKISGLISRIKEAIHTQQDVDSTSDLFAKMSMEAEESRQPSSSGARHENENEMEILGAIINREGGEKLLVDERVSEEEVASKKALEKQRHSIPSGERFVPSKSIHLKSISQIPPSQLDNMKKPDGEKEKPAKKYSPKKLSSKPLEADERTDVAIKLKYRYDDSLEDASISRSTKHESVKSISMEEAINLQREQKQKWEEMRTRQAVEKLAQGLHLKIGEFDTEGSRQMAYRVKEDVDSDDEPD